MKNAVLNDELTLSYPRVFHVMDEGERARVFRDANPDRWAIWDTRHHIIVAIQWHRSNALLVKFVGERGLAKRVEDAARKAYQKKGFKSEGFFEVEMCGRPTQGVRFSYEIEGVRQVCEALVAKKGPCVYTLTYYARETNAQQSHRVFDKILSSMQFV